MPTLLDTLAGGQNQMTGQQQPNFFERALPTVGGIVGGIGGELVDPFGGGIAGAAIGSGLGKAAQNHFTGQDVGSGVLGAAAEGGIGQLGGGLLGGLFKGAGGAIGSAGTRMAEQQAAKETAQGVNAVYGSVPKGVRQALGSKANTDFVQNLGLDASNPENLVNIGNQSNDILNSQLNSILTQHGPVDLSDYNQVIKDAISKRSNVLGSYDPIAQSRGRLGPNNSAAGKLLRQLEPVGQGTARLESDPTEARSLITKLQAMAADAKPVRSAQTGAIDPEQKATYDAINDVVSQLKNRVYERPGVGESITALKGNIQPEDVGGNQALADHLNTVLTNAKSGQDVLSELSRFTNMSKLGQEGQKALQDVTSKAYTQNAEPSGINPMGVVGSLASASHPVGALTAAVSHVAQSGKAPSVLEKVGDLLTRMSPFTKGTGQVVAHGADFAPQEQGNNAMQQAPQANPYQTGGMAAAAESSPALLALQSGLIGLQDPYMASSYAPLVNNNTDTIQKALTANSALQALEQTYNQAGGGQGLAGGLLAKLGGALTGGAPQLYGQQRDQLQQILTKEGIPISAIPDLTANQGAAQQGFSTLQQVLNSLTGGNTSVLAGLPAAR